MNWKKMNKWGNLETVFLIPLVIIYVCILIEYKKYFDLIGIE